MARRHLATVLVAVATVLLAVGLVLDYGAATTAPSRVGDHAVALLDEPAVRDALVAEATTSITDDISDASGLPSAAVRSQVAPIVPRVVDSPAFARAWRSAAVRVTGKLTDTRERTVAVTVRDLDDVVTDALGPLPAPVAAGLRAAGDVDIVSFRRSPDTVKRTERLEQAFDLGRPSVLAAAVLVLVALAVSSRRPSTLIAVGVGCVVAGVGVVAIELVARSIALSGVSDRTDHEVTAAVWDQLLGGLRTRAVVVGAVGIAVAGVAAALRPQRPARPVRGSGR